MRLLHSIAILLTKGYTHNYLLNIIPKAAANIGTKNKVKLSDIRKNEGTIWQTTECEFASFLQREI